MILKTASSSHNTRRASGKVGIGQIQGIHFCSGKITIVPSNRHTTFCNKVRKIWSSIAAALCRTSRTCSHWNWNSCIGYSSEIWWNGGYCSSCHWNSERTCANLLVDVMSTEKAMSIEFKIQIKRGKIVKARLQQLQTKLAPKQLLTTTKNSCCVASVRTGTVRTNSRCRSFIITDT